MKKTLALLLVAIMAITCTLAALSVSAEETVYTDKVDLMPQSESAIKVNGGVPLFSLKDGKLSLTRDGENDIAWPSIVYDVKKEIDLNATPFLHMSFETSGEGDRGVNGFLFVVDPDGNELGLQISAIGGNGVDDFRDTAELYANIPTYIEKYIADSLEENPDLTFDMSGKVTLDRITLSVYGGMGETIVWNTLALAKEGEDDEPEPTPSEDETSEDEGSSAEASDDNTASAAESSDTGAASSTPTESSSAPTTGDNTNVILFVVLGVVALAGVVAVVKVRH